MTSSQFRFSFLVGLALAAVGATIASKAPVGLSLMAVGAAISALALVTRRARNPAANLSVVTEDSRPLRDTRPDHWGR